MGTTTDTALKCVACSAEVSWADCDKGHEWCYQTECDNPLGCASGVESGIRSRRAELVDRGLVVDTGRRVRLASGRYSIVWGLANVGR